MYVAPRVLGVLGVPGVPGVRNFNVTPLQFEPVGLAYVRSEIWRARVRNAATYVRARYGLHRLPPWLFRLELARFFVSWFRVLGPLVACLARRAVVPSHVRNPSLVHCSRATPKDERVLRHRQRDLAPIVFGCEGVLLIAVCPLLFEIGFARIVEAA